MIYSTDILNRVVCGDCLEVMKLIPEGGVHFIFTDPPYAISNEVVITRGRDKMNIYSCRIKVLKTGYLPETAEDEIEILVLAKGPKQAVEKSKHYRKVGTYKKTIEVLDATLEGTIDIE